MATVEIQRFHSLFIWRVPPDRGPRRRRSAAWATTPEEEDNFFSGGERIQRNHGTTAGAVKASHKLIESR